MAISLNSLNPTKKDFAKRNPLEAPEFTEKINSKTPSVFVSKDFKSFSKDLTVSRKLRNTLQLLKVQPKSKVTCNIKSNGDETHFWAGSDFGTACLPVCMFQCPNDATSDGVTKMGWFSTSFNVCAWLGIGRQTFLFQMEPIRCFTSWHQMGAPSHDWALLARSVTSIAGFLKVGSHDAKFDIARDLAPKQQS